MFVLNDSLLICVSKGLSKIYLDLTGPFRAL